MSNSASRRFTLSNNGGLPLRIAQFFDNHSAAAGCTHNSSTPRAPPKIMHVPRKRGNKTEMGRGLKHGPSCFGQASHQEQYTTDCTVLLLCRAPTVCRVDTRDFARGIALLSAHCVIEPHISRGIHCSVILYKWTRSAIAARRCLWRTHWNARGVLAEALL